MELLIRCGSELFESLASGILFGRFFCGTGGAEAQLLANGTEPATAERLPE